MSFNQILTDYFVFFMVWELFWKAFALWKSARKNELIWFICIIALNTLGLLPMIYLIYDKALREKFSQIENTFFKKRQKE